MTDKNRIEMRQDPETGFFKPVASLGDWVTAITPFGYSFAAHDFEIVILFTTRQDGRVAWSVNLIETDSNVHVETGITPSAGFCASINQAIYKVTRKANWPQPLNADKMDLDTFDLEVL